MCRVVSAVCHTSSDGGCSPHDGLSIAPSENKVGCAIQLHALCYDFLRKSLDGKSWFLYNLNRNYGSLHINLS